MKKVLMFVCVLALVVAFTLPAMADELISTAGQDVLVDGKIVQSIRGFDPAQPVYVANDLNGWMVSYDAGVGSNELLAEKVGDKWKASGMKGMHFNFVQLKEPGQFTALNAKWPRLERFTGADGIVNREPKEDNPGGHGLCIYIE